MTFKLSVIGSVALTEKEGKDVRAVLAQPKRLALLVYLTIAQPAGFHRRDTLLALFWPDFDEAAARAALSRAVYYLRQALGDDVIVGRGDHELAIDRAMLSCDLFGFEDCVNRGDASTALAMYQGDMLPGFHVDDAAAFADWLDGQRQRVLTLATKCAIDGAESAERSGDLAAAVTLGREASRLAPYSESVMTDLMRRLEAQGNRAEAIAAYETFAQHYEAELESTPSITLRTLAARIRKGEAIATGSPGTRNPDELTSSGVTEVRSMPHAEIGVSDSAGEFLNLLFRPDRDSKGEPVRPAGKMPRLRLVRDHRSPSDVLRRTVPWLIAALAVVSLLWVLLRR